MPFDKTKCYRNNYHNNQYFVRVKRDYYHLCKGGNTTYIVHIYNHHKYSYRLDSCIVDNIHPLIPFYTDDSNPSSFLENTDYDSCSDNTWFYQRAFNVSLHFTSLLLFLCSSAFFLLFMFIIKIL